MSKENKKDVEETVKLLLQLDKNSLLLIDNGAKLLKSYQDLNSKEKELQKA